MSKQPHTLIKPRAAATPIQSEDTLHQFAHAMAQQDLSSVPQHKRRRAIFDHFITVMAQSVPDPTTRRELLLSQRLRRALNPK